MKQFYLLILLSIVCFEQGNSQTLLNENFNYDTSGLTSNGLGNNVSGGNWTTAGGNLNKVQVIDGNLQYPNYGSSNIGRSIYFVSSTASSEWIRHKFASQPTGTIYSSLLIKVADTAGLSNNNTVNGDYFLSVEPLSATNFYGRLSVRKGSIGNTFQLGIRANANVNAVFSSTNYTPNTTYLVVVSYTIVAGANNDSTMLWVNPTTSSMPVPDVVSVITTGGDASDIGGVLLRQGSAGTPNMQIDGIHIGLSWTDIMSANLGPAPSVNTISYVANGMTFGVFNWKKPGDYNNASMQTIAFLKKVNAITTGINTKATTSYIANSNFKSTVSSYQNDSLAKCIFIGDTNTFSITGLDTGTKYNILIYVVRNNDSVYSNPTIGSGTTQTKAPLFVNNLFYSNVNYTSADYNWTKPIGYTDSTMTVLLFIRPGTKIPDVGYQSTNPNYYIPNADYNQNGTVFLPDPYSKCIYNGDGNSVHITGLMAGKTYFVAAFVVRNIDSSYYSEMTQVAVKARSQPVYVDHLGVTPTGEHSINVQYARGISYVYSTQTTITLIKKGSPINTQEYIIQAANSYIPSKDFNGPSSRFQFDTLARCVQNSDESNIDITGLEPNTLYYFLIYTIFTSDSSHSIGVTAFCKTFGTVPPVNAAGVLKVTAKSASTATVSWLKDSTYNDTITTTVVFLKKENPLFFGTPNVNPINYLADTVAEMGTAYQNDSLAHCVFNGNGNTFQISGMQAATKYYLIAYAVRLVDSSYSNAILGYTITYSNPVSNILVEGKSSTSARISWTKPTRFDSTSSMILVFVKQDSAITQGDVKANSDMYTANPIVGLGSKFINDTKAFCVYRGLGNYVDISHLIQSKNYLVLIYVVSANDTNYSLPATGFGTTLTQAPFRDIGSVNKTNMITGLPDSIDMRVTLRGIVYGFNQSSVGLKMLMRDATGGITFNSLGNYFGYYGVEGDSVEVQGNIGSLRGLCVINIDTLKVLGNAKPINQGRLVNKLNESTENDLVKVDNLKLIGNTDITWNPIKIYNALTTTNDTIAIKILLDCQLAGAAIPTTPTFNLTGIASQVSTSVTSPYAFNGYQLLPRWNTDLVLNYPDTLDHFHLLSPIANYTLAIEGNPTQKIVFTWSSAKSNGISKPTYQILVDTLGGSFSPSKINIGSGLSGFDTVSNLSFSYLATQLKLFPIKTYKAQWKIMALLGSYVRYSDEVFTLIFQRNYFTGNMEVVDDASFQLYPNPANTGFFVSSEETIETISIINQVGEVVMQQMINENEAAINCGQLKGGIYFVSIITNNGMITKKLLLN